MNYLNLNHIHFTTVVYETKTHGTFDSRVKIYSYTLQHVLTEIQQ